MTTRSPTGPHTDQQPSPTGPPPAGPAAGAVPQPTVASDHRTDGVLWAGPPNFNALRRSRVTDREPGPPEWVVVGSLVGMNLTQHVLHLPWWVRPVEAAALVGSARLSGLTWAQLGLGRERMPCGVRWGLGAVAVVGVVYTAGALLPATRPAFLDTRYDLPLPAALGSALVVIPLGTVLPEELAFRSVLWGALDRYSRPWQVLATTSVLFGLWHVLPALHVGATNDGVASATGGNEAVAVLGTVALTTVGGLVFGELRRRSGSVLASAGAHWATNALGVLFGVAIRYAAG